MEYLQFISCPDDTSFLGHYLANLSVEPSFALQVYFSDYGNTEWVENGSIIKLPAKLQTLPGFAIEASVFGLQPVGGAWSNDACARFGDLVMADSCNVEVVDETISKVAVSITVQGQSPAMMLINGMLYTIVFCVHSSACMTDDWLIHSL